MRVLTHGSWVRLAAEPYGDRSGRQIVALGLAGLGLPLLVSVLLSRRRASALRRVPVPVLRVLARERWGRTEVFAEHDTDGAHPILNYEPHTSDRTHLRQARLYGSPGEGGESILASTTESGLWQVEATAVRAPQGAGRRGHAGAVGVTPLLSAGTTARVMGAAGAGPGAGRQGAGAG
ncbi:hypothetical protein [Streptomyces sp. NBC_01190]|uniref:hypothetical protein n=1 Tax=Streptomyces sp. NBC_01190 TaxID=2903767 RepID=UPI003870A744|nr:hypothetical protein OG519_16495 [Streptomyces sp. NBC_01190]